MAIQQTERLVFSSGRVFVNPAGGGARVPYANCNDISADVKIDQKEIWAEQGFPIGVADGHRSIDIAVKHYTLALGPLAADLGLAAPVTGNTAFAYDEGGTVGPSGQGAPAAPVITSVAGGTQAARTDFARISYVSAAGESALSPEASTAIALNQVGSVASPAAAAGATGWNCYMSTATGTETKQNASPIPIGTAFLEPNSGLVVGAPLPTATTAVLLNGNAFTLNSLDLVVLTKVGSAIVPRRYAIVAAGSEVAGSAASVSALGVITFAGGDTGLTFTATYQYTNTAGTLIKISNPVMNSTPSYQMVLVKKDISPLDQSSGQLILQLNAVRPGSIKMPFKEGEWSNFERAFKAFADPTGVVGYLQFVNV